MNDLIVQFARLWGQNEILPLCFTKEDEEKANILKSYDSEELKVILSEWAKEYLEDDDYFDIVDFFEMKLDKLYRGV